MNKLTKIGLSINKEIKNHGYTLACLYQISTLLEQEVVDIDIDFVTNLLHDNRKFAQLVETIFHENKNQIEAGNLAYIIKGDIPLLIMESYLMMKDITIVEHEIDFDDSIIDNNIKLYMNDLEKRPVLTREQEKELLSRIANQDTKARSFFLECNLRLVFNIAKKYMNKGFTNGMELLDIIQEGNFGLIRALNKFDVEKGFKFSTYASWWIKQSIRIAILNHGAIRFPIRAQGKMKIYYKTKEELTNQLERFPNQEEIANAMNCYVSTVQICEMMENRTIYSMNQNIDEDYDSSLENIIASDDLTPEELMVNKDLRENVKEYLESNLTKREIFVLTLRFGLDNHSMHTLEEIGKILGVTRERVHIIERKALGKLRYQKDKMQEEDSDTSLQSLFFNPSYPEVLEKKYLPSEEVSWKIKKEVPLELVTNKKKSIYQFFSEYSKENVDMVISLLSAKEVALLKVRFGKNLNGVSKRVLTREQTHQLNLILIPKMIRMLKELEKGNTINSSMESAKVMVKK